jgi:hypothetical protein
VGAVHVAVDLKMIGVPIGNAYDRITMPEPPVPPVANPLE